MPTDVVMPQMGESVAEGTIVRWLKKVGDPIDRDEPLFEISTDKVDAEIPAPAAGVVSEIRHGEGETVEVNTVVAVIDTAGIRQTAPSAAEPERQVEGADEAVQPRAERVPTRDVAPQEKAVHRRSSPLVRRIAKEHNVDIGRIPGTGASGRVTKDDILSFLRNTPGEAVARARVTQGESGVQPSFAVAAGVGLAGQTVPMSVMRRKIAEHMVSSRRTSAHAHSVVEINFQAVDRVRHAMKARYEREGAKLTYLSFIIKAAADALKAVPVINASVSGESIVYHREVNIGMAVALDWGLIVPVIRNADQKSLLEISRSVADLANRARAKQLKPDEVAGGTFTVTNPGVFGAIVGMPIINQPQVAILAVGAVQKRVIVIDDAIAIRPMAFFAMGFDHRIVDGAVADQFLQHVQRTLENWKEDGV
jgi:2-oxoglutarate dehydrogenase E2 component (dihydrolipoamide succinyltransferase)